MKPWRDIFSVNKWNGIVRAYQQGGLSSKSKTLGRHIQSIFKDGVKLPREITPLTEMIGQYHATEKTDLAKVPSRVMQLKAIEILARRYLERFHADRRNKTRDEAGDFTSLEAYVWSLAQHAARKADYLTKLDEYYARVRVRNAYVVGNNISASASFIQYLQKPSRTDPGLSSVAALYKLEKEDPLHRDVELHFDKGGRTLTRQTVIGTSMNMLFAQWAGLYDDDCLEVSETFRPKEVPFFMWLEGTKACLGEKEEQLGPGSTFEQTAGAIHSVGYGRADLIRLVYPWGGALYCKQLDVLDAPGPGVLFDTPSLVLSESKEKGALAYVFSRGCELFSAAHKPQRFHHSSFLSGAKVRCAGMIKVVNGKVRLLSNDSGHYRPTANQLRQLAEALERYWAPDGVVKYWAGAGWKVEEWWKFTGRGWSHRADPRLRPISHAGQARWHQNHSR
jgi:hypothetical protein